MRKMRPVKRKQANKSLAEKSKALKYLENGMSSKDVAAKYDVPRKPVLTWVKSKHKLTTSLKKGNELLKKKIHVARTMKN